MNSGNGQGGVSFPRRNRRNSPSQLKRARQRMTIEHLEGRQLMAYSTLAASYSVDANSIGSVEIVDSAGSDTNLVVSVSNGYMTHTGDGNTGPNPGQFNSLFDWDSTTAGDQMLAANAGSTLTLDSNDGTDTTTFGTAAVPASANPSAIVAKNDDEGSNATLIVDDSANTSAAAYSYENKFINYPGGGTVNILDAMTGGITIKGGSAGDSFDIKETFEDEPISLIGGAGDDSAVIRSALAPVNVDLMGGKNDVLVSDDGSMMGIADTVDVKATGGTATLALNTSGDSLEGVVTLAAGKVAGMATGDITFDSTVTTIDLYGPTAADLTYDIEGTAAANKTTIHGGAGEGTPATTNTYKVGVGGSMDAVLGPVVIKGGQDDELILDDSDESDDITYSLGESTFARTGAFGADGLTYDGVSKVKLNAGGDAEVAGKMTIDVNGTAIGSTTEITGGGGDDEVTVNSTAPTGSLSIDSGAGTDTVNVLGNNAEVDITSSGTATVNFGAAGGSGSMRNIAAKVEVDGAAASTSLRFNDEGDTTGRDVSFSINNGSGIVTGMAPGEIRFKTAAASDIALNGGSGGDTFEIEETVADIEMSLGSGTGMDAVHVLATSVGSTLKIDGQGSEDDKDEITLGGNESQDTPGLKAILGTVTVAGSAGSVRLIYDGSRDSTAYQVALDGSSVSGLTTGSVTFDPTAIDSLTIKTGDGADTFTVNDTVAGAETILESGKGSDAITVHGTGDGSDLAIGGQGDPESVTIDGARLIKGDIVVNNYGSQTDLTISDGFGAERDQATLSAQEGIGKFSGMTKGEVFYQISEVSHLTVDGYYTDPETYDRIDLKVDLDGGNPIPSGGLTFNAGGDLAVRGELPDGPLWGESYTPDGRGSGRLRLNDHNTWTEINFNGVNLLNDTAVSYNFAFYDNIKPDGSFIVADGGVVEDFQTIIIFSGSRDWNFGPAQLANKSDVRITTARPDSGSDGPPVEPATDINGTVNIRQSPSAINSLSVETLNGGNDLIQVQALPKYFDTGVQAFSGDDVMNVSAGDLAPGSATTLDGGTGQNTLNFDAGGQSFNMWRGEYPGEVVIRLSRGDQPDAYIYATNFQAIHVTNPPYTPPTLDTEEPRDLHAVEGTQVSYADVATFRSNAPGARAADFTATVDWGDGTRTAGVIVQDADDSSLFYVRGSHTYSEAGSYEIRAFVRSSGSFLSGPFWGDPEDDIQPFDEDDADAQPYPITVTYTTAPSDSEGDPITAVVRVAEAPLTVVVNAVTAVEGDSTPFMPIATFTDKGGVDPDDQDPISRYRVSVDWGDGQGMVPVDPGMIRRIGDTDSFLVLGSHTYADHGVYTVTVVVEDYGRQSGIESEGDEGPPNLAMATAMATIADAPLLDPVGIDFGATAGSNLSLQTVAVFSDGNPMGDQADFTAAIDWGDGTTSTGLVQAFVRDGDGPFRTSFRVLGNHKYQDAGNYTVIVTVKDDGGKQATMTAMAGVGVQAPTVLAAIPVSAQEGTALANIPLATFVDANRSGSAGDFLATIDWGDGSTTVGLITKVGGTAEGSLYAVAGSHTYADQGSFTVKVTVADHRGNTIVATAPATVNDAPLVAHGGVITGVEGSPTGPALLAVFTDLGGAEAPSSYTASIDWGDGSAPGVGSITSMGTANGIVFLVRGDHTYARPGNFPVTIKVAGQGGSTAVASSQAVVSGAALSPAAGQPTVAMNEGEPFTGPIASFLDANPGSNPGDFAAAINWGDGSPIELGTITQPGGPGTPYFVIGSHTYADSGVDGGVGGFGLLVQVVDTGGSRASIAGRAYVADVAINLGGQLEASSDSGVFNSDGITNVKQPTFSGISEANAVVKLFAQPTGGGSMFTIGQVAADASGAWRINSIPLPDGSYSIVAKTVDASGNTSATATLMPNADRGPLVIDTVGPRVTQDQFNPDSGRFLLSFQDDRSGMDAWSIVDTKNFTLTTGDNKPAGTFWLGNATPSPAGLSPTYPQSVVMYMADGSRPAAGDYNVSALASGSALRSGIRDMAGNALDGEFYGGLPSGNGIPGGDFAARIAVSSARGSTLTNGTPVVTTAQVNANPAPTQANARAARLLAARQARAAALAAHDAALAHIQVPRRRQGR